MAFEYTPYRSPYVGAIADLIGQRGDIAAQQALNEAKTRSQAVSSVAQSLGNLAQYRADAPKRRLEQATLAEKQQQLADAQEARSGKQSLATLLSPDYVEGFQPQGPTPVDASGEAGILPKSPSLVKNIGGVKQFDVDAIQAAMGQLGHGAWFLENRNAIDSLNKSMLDRHVLGKQLGREAADLYLKAARESDSLAQATEKDTMGASFKVQAAHTLVDALDDLIPSEQREAIQKALVVGDTRMADELAQQYATPETIQRANVAPGAVNVGFSSRTGLPVTGTEIFGAKPQETTAQYNARVNAARAKIKAGTATPDEQALVEGVDADIAARRTPQPIDKEHADLLTKKANGTLTPAETMRLHAIEQMRKFIPQFNVENRQEPLVRVRYFDPSLGRTVEEYVPRSEAGGTKRIAPLSGTEQNRFDSAATVIDVGQAILDSLKDPKVAEVVGPAMGRFNTIRELIGNPPPELAGLAGEIESFALANMGVHGMRSVQGAKMLAQLLDAKHTPESMAAAVNGLLKFSRSFVGRIGDAEIKQPKFDAGQLPSLNIRIGQTPVATPSATAPVVSAR